MVCLGDLDASLFDEDEAVYSISQFSWNIASTIVVRTCRLIGKDRPGRPIKVGCVEFGVGTVTGAVSSSCCCQF